MDYPDFDIEWPLIHTFRAYRALVDADITQQPRSVDKAGSCRNEEDEDRIVSWNEFSWDSFHIWLQSEAKQDAYIRTLANEHRSSYQVLRDFMDGNWHDEAEPLDLVRTCLQTEREERTYEPRTYLGLVVGLFELEMKFTPISYGQLEILSFRRRDAAKSASAQRIAYACLESARVANGHKTNQRKRQGPEEVLDDVKSKNRIPGLPLYLWDRVDFKTVVVHELQDQRPHYTCVSHTWGRWEVCKPVKVCGVPWPVPQNSRFMVQDLPTILHKAKIATRYVWLDLLCIPQGDFDSRNQALEVAKQAGIFHNAAAGIAWMNHVQSWDKLLPAIEWHAYSFLQSGSGLPFDDAGRYRESAQEDIDDASDLFHKIDFWTNHSFLGQELHDADTVESPQKPESFHWTTCCHRSLTDCVVGSRMSLEQVSYRANPFFAFRFPDWYSSLWTLQEAYLVPTMSLASASFVYLRTSAGISITFDALYALFEHSGWDKSRASRQLFWRWNPFEKPTPVELIIMADQRQCSDQRAPAIMSVLGITDWYTKQIATFRRKPGEGTLVLGKYPLAFVQEAARKIGPLFFGTDHFGHKDCSEGTTFTMLPFRARRNYPVSDYLPKWTTQRQDARHETWQVTSDGRVMIREAVSVAAGSAPPHLQPRTAINSLVYGNGFTENVDLQAKLDSLARTSGTESVYSFAVHLAQDLTSQMGIILVGSRLEGDRSAKLLLHKAAAYVIPRPTKTRERILHHGAWPEMPPAQKVDWVAV